MSVQLSRRQWLLGVSVAALSALGPRRAAAFGQSGGFRARRLITTGQRTGEPRETALRRWSAELVRRTSAPGNLELLRVAADSQALTDEPFAVWCGAGDVPPLTQAERRGLEIYFARGGLLFVEDFEPNVGAFARAAERELVRLLPGSAPIELDSKHVIFKSYYLLDRPAGRVPGGATLRAIVRGRSAQVLFSRCDLLGALASREDGSFVYPMETGGDRQRELALRYATNLAMYALCSDYKDDQVHVPWLLRRRGGVNP